MRFLVNIRNRRDLALWAVYVPMRVVVKPQLNDEWKYVDAEPDCDEDGALLLNEVDDNCSLITGYSFAGKDDPSCHSPRQIQVDHGEEHRESLNTNPCEDKSFGNDERQRKVSIAESTSFAGLRRERRSYRGRKSKRVDGDEQSTEESVSNSHRVGERQGDCRVAQNGSETLSNIDCYMDILLNITEDVSEDDIRQAMKLLQREVGSFERENGELATRQALKRIYEMMEKRRDDGFTIERAVYLIGKLARTAIWVPNIIAETGGSEHLVNVMTEHQASSVIQERAVATFLHMTSKSQARAAIVAAKGAESICWAMKGFKTIKTIQLQGSTALCNLAFASNDNKRRLGKIGGIDAVVRAMDAHSSDGGIQARCCLALRNLTCRNRVNQWIAGRACATEAIVRAMQEFQDDVNVQYQGCVALANLSSDEPENRCRAADAGVLEATLFALRTYTTHGGLAEHGLVLLFNLVQTSAGIQKKIGDLGGIVVIISCLRQHITAPSILEMGCKVLRYLLFVKENRISVYDCCGLEIIVRVLREGAKSKAVAEAAIYAIGNSAYDYPESKKAIGRYGGMSALVDVMSEHMDSAEIQEHGCRALRNLADSDEFSGRLLAESGAIDSCIFACSGYPENARIQEHACAMLFNMAYSDANIRRMKGLDVERVLSQAQESHSEDQAVQNQAGALQEKIKGSYRGDSRQPSSLKSSFNLGSLTRKGSGKLLTQSSSRRRSHRTGSGDYSQLARKISEHSSSSRSPRQ